MEKKVVVITGGSDGLGKETAKRLSANFKVVILSPTAEKLEKTAKEIGCDFEIADVSSFKSLETVCDKIVKKFGGIDCWINNAGKWIQGELDENDPNQIAEVVKVNLLGVINGTKAAARIMKRQKNGLIININSQSGLYPKEERSVYNGTKWGVTGFTKSIQPELAKYGIRVTQVHPGGMKTEMFAKAGNPKDKTNFIDTSEVAKLIEFIMSLNPTTDITEIGIKNIFN